MIRSRERRPLSLLERPFFVAYVTAPALVRLNCPLDVPALAPMIRRARARSDEGGEALGKWHEMRSGPNIPAEK